MSRALGKAIPRAMSSDLADASAVPYFLGDEPMSVAELRRRLAESTLPERRRLLAKILREARVTEAWLFTTPSKVAARWSELAPLLGKRRRFWELLLGEWRRQGLLAS